MPKKNNQQPMSAEEKKKKTLAYINDYVSENYDKGTFVCPKGKLKEYHRQARERGFSSFSEYVRNLIEEDAEPV